MTNCKKLMDMVCESCLHTGSPPKRASDLLHVECDYQDGFSSAIGVRVAAGKRTKSSNYLTSPKYCLILFSFRRTHYALGTII